MGWDIQAKLKLCGRDLDLWGRNLVRQHNKRINFQKTILGSFQGRRDSISLHELEEAKNELQRLLKFAEDFWHERAKVFFLQARDLNTRAFHRFANGRKKKKSFSTLQNDEGQCVSRGNGLQELISKYFIELYTSGGVEDDVVISCIEKIVINNHNDFLLSTFSPDKVKAAVFFMHRDKAPGIIQPSIKSTGLLQAQMSQRLICYGLIQIFCWRGSIITMWL